MASCPRSHAELLVGQLAVVVAGDAGVERDDPQPVDLVAPGPAGLVVDVEQPACELRPLVVVAHHPHDLGAEVGCDRLDQLAQPRVRRRLGLVGQVAGEHQELRRRVEPGDPLEREPQAVLGVHDAVLTLPVGEQVRVGEVCDDVPGCGVLTELDHDRRLEPPLE